MNQKQKEDFHTYVNTSIALKEPNTKQINQKVGYSRNDEIVPER
jgi:hypothetical protein